MNNYSYVDIIILYFTEYVNRFVVLFLLFGYNEAIMDLEVLI